MENKIVGAWETHRLVIVPRVELGEMGEVTKMMHQMDVNNVNVMPARRKKKLIIPE